MKKSIKSLLFDKSYMSYFFSSALSMGASNILQFTLAIYILERTGSPLIYASILSIIVFPRILLTPISGVVGDRYKRLSIMKVLNVFQIIIMFFYVIICMSGNDMPLVLIYILVVLLEIIEIFYNVAENSILAEIVDNNLIDEAVTLSKVDDGIVYITTPVIAVFIFKKFGLTGTFILIIGLLILSFLLNFKIRTQFATEIEKKGVTGIKTYYREFKEGVDVIKNDPIIRLFMFIPPLINFSFDAVFSVVITYVFLEVFKLSEYVYGVYRTTISVVGMVVPIVILPFVKKFKRNTLLKYAVISISAFIFMIGICVYYGMHISKHNILFIVFLITLFDCLLISSVIPLNIASQIFFQKKLSNKYRSRVSSVFRTFAFSAIPLGNMFYGYLSDKLPAYICIFIASLLIIATYPLVIRLSARENISL